MKPGHLVVNADWVLMVIGFGTEPSFVLFCFVILKPYYHKGDTDSVGFAPISILNYFKSLPS